MTDDMRAPFYGRFPLAGSTVERFRMTVPLNVRALVAGKTVLFNLEQVIDCEEKTVLCKFFGKENVIINMHTRDLKSAEKRRRSVDAQAQNFYDSLLNPPKDISHRNLVALAGDIYRKMVELNEDNPRNLNDMSIVKGFGRMVREGRLVPPPDIIISRDGEIRELALAKMILGDDMTNNINSMPPSDNNAEGMESYYGHITTAVLMENGVYINDKQRSVLLEKVHEAVCDASIHVKRLYQGDYTPDLAASKYPVFSKPNEVLTIRKMFEEWQADGDPKALKSIANVKKMVDRFEAFFGAKRDLESVEPNDVAKWQTWLREQPNQRGSGGNLSEVTINYHVVMTGTLYNVGIKRRILKENPFDGMTTTIRGQYAKRMQDYSDDETARLLALANKEVNLIRRWVPLIIACTGVRIGEVAQLYVERVVLDAPIPYFNIQEAEDKGRTKNEFAPRIIPIHAALLTDDFKSFVASVDKGPLFYRLGKSKRKEPWNNVGDEMTSWIREQGFNDPKKAPNHGLRHWWRTRISLERPDVPTPQSDMLEYLFGHFSRGSKDRYLHYDRPETTNSVIQRLHLPTLT